MAPRALRRQADAAALEGEGAGETVGGRHGHADDVRQFLDPHGRNAQGVREYVAGDLPVRRRQFGARNSLCGRSSVAGHRSTVAIIRAGFDPGRDRKKITALPISTFSNHATACTFARQ
jgi:hypothetical protein